MRCFLPPSQTGDGLHFSEDEDIVLVRSLDFVSDYIDDCPWLSRETPKAVRSQPHAPNNKDTVDESCASGWKTIFFMSESLMRGPAMGTPFKIFLIKSLNFPNIYIEFHFLFVFLKKLVSESPSKKSASNRTPERGRTTPQHRQERRDRDRERTAENKENVAAQDRDVDLFALPPPRTPASSRKNARQKNALTSPNHNASGAKGHGVTPKGERSRRGIRQEFRPSGVLFVRRN